MANQRRNNQKSKAEELLEQCGIRTPPVPVERIAKFLGAQVRYSPLDEELSGMIFVKDGVPIIGVNSLHHPNRQRFTIAHEIAHLVLHRPLITASVHVDKDFPILMRGTVAGMGVDSVEIAANDFAAELLIPREMLDELLAGKPFDIENDKPLEDLAKKFRVSKQMLIFRIQNLSRD